MYYCMKKGKNRDFISSTSSQLISSCVAAIIPWQSQENIILDDLLSVLEGFQGKYIVAQPLLGKYDPRLFTVADSIGKCFLLSLIYMHREIIVIIKTIDV